MTPPDEVESLTAARAGAMAGTEPSDGLRVRWYLHYLKGDSLNFGLGCQRSLDSA